MVHSRACGFVQQTVQIVARVCTLTQSNLIRYTGLKILFEWELLCNLKINKPV